MIWVFFLSPVTPQKIPDPLAPAPSPSGEHTTPKKHAFSSVSKSPISCFVPRLQQTANLLSDRPRSPLYCSALQKKRSRNVNRGIKSYRLWQETLWVLFTAGSERERISWQMCCIQKNSRKKERKRGERISSLFHWGCLRTAHEVTQKAIILITAPSLPHMVMTS